MNLLQRLRSLRHAHSLWWSSQLAWRRGAYRENPVRELTGLSTAQQRRILGLQGIYGLNLEARFNRANALENYTYLDLLDCAREAAGEDWPQGRVTLDVGSKNFYYAGVLHAVFAPRRLIGLELEGYRVFPNLYSRHDHAMAHIAGLPDTEFRVGDVRAFREPVGLVTNFYPFVHAETHLAWGLPLSRFQPQDYFTAIAALLADGGEMIMVNQGNQEAESAARFCVAAGMHRAFAMVMESPLMPRPAPPVLSRWRVAAGPSV